MLLSRVRRLSDVDRRLFVTLEHLVVPYLVETTEWRLRVNIGPLYVLVLSSGPKSPKERGKESQQLICHFPGIISNHHHHYIFHLS